MKYLVVRGCQWREFCTYGKEGQELTAADLVSDGKPLPPEVVAHFVGNGSLKPVEGDQ